MSHFRFCRHVAVAAVALASWGAADAARGAGDAVALERDGRAERWIEQLGHRDYPMRQEAQAELLRLGPGALEALETAAEQGDLEVAARARYLLRLIQWEWLAKLGPEEIAQQLKDYRDLDGASRLARIRQFGALRGGKGVAVLCRLVRFEVSERLSKYAAMEVLQQVPTGQAPGEQLAGVVREHLGTTRRVGARWLRTWLEAAAPADSLPVWQRLVDDELAEFERRPSRTAPSIITSLLLEHVARLDGAGRKNEAIQQLRKLFALEKGDSRSLLQLAEFLVRQKAWELIEEMETRFRVPVSSSPKLLYLVAHAKAEQGKTQESEALVQQSRRCYPGRGETAVYRHFDVARYLVAQGLFTWAEQECAYVVAQLERRHVMALAAREVLAAMLHDQGHDLRAAEALQDVVAVLEEAKAEKTELPVENLSFYAGQMHYYRACHWLGKGELARQREALEKALTADASNVDVLIAARQLAHRAPPLGMKVTEAIQSSAAKMRQEMREQPNRPGPYNDLAWLLANTEGDLEEALRCSKKSLELEPNNSSFYDTLARVHYARGDYPSAIECQGKAAQLNPHSGQIARQLQMLKSAMEAKKKQQPTGAS